jgi:hypothetical protein
MSETSADGPKDFDIAHLGYTAVEDRKVVVRIVVGYIGIGYIVVGCTVAVEGRTAVVQT